MSATEAAARVSPIAGRRLVDLSMPIVDHWRFAPEIEVRSSVEVGQPFHSTYLTCRTHSFTHVDAPSHVDTDGRPLGGLNLDDLWGEASVVDLSDLGDLARIGESELADRSDAVREGDIVLLRTDHESRHPTSTREYWSMAPWVDASAARWLRTGGARAVGFDFPQDRSTRAPYDDAYVAEEHDLEDNWATHRLLLANGIPLVEYLTNLAAIDGPRTLVALLPLNLPDGDGAPTRAVAFG